MVLESTLESLVSWTARKSNQSILKEISPESALEGLMLHKEPSSYTKNLVHSKHIHVCEMNNMHVRTSNAITLLYLIQRLVEARLTHQPRDPPYCPEEPNSTDGF